MLDQAPVRNVRTWPAMPREKAQAAPTVRLKVVDGCHRGRRGRKRNATNEMLKGGIAMNKQGDMNDEEHESDEALIARFRKEAPDVADFVADAFENMRVVDKTIDPGEIQSRF